MSFNRKKPLKTAFLVCPGYYVIDIVNAHTVFGTQPDSEVHLVWKNRDPVNGFVNFPTIPTTTFADCPDDLDVLVVGAIPAEILEDQETLKFVKKHAANGCYMMGICGGALLFGAAGLLKGRKATSNFHSTEHLAKFGAEPVLTSEVVIDGNYYTAGPSHGCMEAALLLLEKLRGRRDAELAELFAEYDPHPPFGCGNPELANPEQVAIIKGIVCTDVEQKVASALRVFNQI